MMKYKHKNSCYSHYVNVAPFGNLTHALSISLFSECFQSLKGQEIYFESVLQCIQEKNNIYSSILSTTIIKYAAFLDMTYYKCKYQSSTYLISLCIKVHMYVAKATPVGHSGFRLVALFTGLVEMTNGGQSDWRYKMYEF